jgi:hypothetical protein
MSKLTLLLRKGSQGADIRHGVVARIQGYPSGTSRSELPFFREVIIPASNGAGLDVDVVPGIYRVQAILPSGEMLQEERKVEDGQTVSIEFALPVARDWLAWQGFEGLASMPSSLQRPPLVESRRVLPELKRPRGILGGLFGRIGGGPAERATETLPAFPDVWRGARKDPTLVLKQQPTAGGSESWKRAVAATEGADFIDGWQDPPDDREIRIESVRKEGEVSLWRVIKSAGQPLDRSDDVPERYWALSDVGDVVETVSIPVPWNVEGAACPVEILVDNAIEHLERRTSLIVRDPDLGGLLAYLGRGRLSSARALVVGLDDAGLIERSIREKMKNPLAACAAAYVGLAIFEPDEQERRGSWLPNIMNSFPWLPDGAIVHARRIIRRPRHSHERNEALAALKHAYQCGIPYFTAGVLQLRDPLLLFSSRDAEARSMLETVSQVASRLDPGQAFTVLRFPKR